MELEGTVAAVTGGTRGIGLAIAEAYLREGASVCINGRSAERGAEIAAQLGSPDRVEFVAADVTDRDDVERFVDRTVERFGRLDVLVNNAGGADDHAPVAELTDEALEMALKWNVWSTFWGMRRALKHMIPQGSGRIINMSSVEGKHGKPGIATYVTAKHAVHGLTKSCAAEVGPAGITVNALCPGMIETYSVQTQGQSAAAAAGMSYEDFLGIFSAETALKRLNTVEEVAAVAVFLASAAGAGTNGSMISIDGGTAAY
jgi:3-hydroxybutyrate dehydrogenase